jgi:translation elongation factor P/translation initiation factor 5A
MIVAGDFRNGVTFEMDGGVYSVIEFQHVKPGKGAAFVRTKLRNVITGAVTETTFNPSAKFPTAFVERKDMQYLMKMAVCITLWILKHMNSSRLMRELWETILSLSQKI